MECKNLLAGPSGQRPLACWGCGFESRIGYGCLPLVSVVCCLCDGPMPRPEVFYRLWCVVVCILEASAMRRSWLALGCCTREREREKDSYGKERYFRVLYLAYLTCHFVFTRS
jgi:hypothetical protein